VGHTHEVAWGTLEEVPWDTLEEDSLVAGQSGRTLVARSVG
jgi:hypothetical protein